MLALSFLNNFLVAGKRPEVWITQRGLDRDLVSLKQETAIDCQMAARVVARRHRHAPFNQNIHDDNRRTEFHLRGRVDTI